MILCDFCGDDLHEASAVRHGCKTFTSKSCTLGSLVQVSNGDWAGCAPCSMLIYADRWEELAQRSAEHFEDHNGRLFSRSELLVYLRALHQEFRENRL